jgi:hypothetical protein
MKQPIIFSNEGHKFIHFFGLLYICTMGIVYFSPGRLCFFSTTLFSPSVKNGQFGGNNNNILLTGVLADASSFLFYLPAHFDSRKSNCHTSSFHHPWIIHPAEKPQIAKKPAIIW